jgi:hypothetical protein
MVRIIKGKFDYSGIPKKNPMKQQWFHKFEALLRNVILLMRDRYDAAPSDKKSDSLFDNQMMVMEIGRIAQYCGTRWITEVNMIYRVLSGQLDLLFTGDMGTVLHRSLDIFKSGILEEMANEVPSNTQYQSSHGLIYYMQALARLKYQIPDAELADYDDTYESLGKRGKYKTDKEVELGFRARLKASIGVSVMHPDLNRKMVTDARENILTALRGMLNEYPEELEDLLKEQREALQKVHTLQTKECELTEEEKNLLRKLKTIKRNEFFTMQQFRSKILDLIARKPTFVLICIKQIDDDEFNAQKSKEEPLNEAESTFLKSIHPQKTLLIEDRLKLERIAQEKPCQLHVHECGGPEIYHKIGKEPFCRSDLIIRFGLSVIPFAKQIEALKEQHASQRNEILNEELLRKGLLRTEQRFMQKPDSHEMHAQEVLLLTVEGTLLLVRKSGILENHFEPYL